MKRIAYLLFAVPFSGAMAQQISDTTELIPVEVRATRAGSKAPFTKTNLKKDAIEKQNLGRDLPFLLNQTPSVVVASDAGNGVGYTGIRIRGTDATRINVTLNGIPFNDAESQGAFFVNLPDIVSSAGSVQVQRGVGTSSNGAGAFGATLNLSTTEDNHEAYAEFNNSYGSFNTWKNTLRAGTGLVGKYFTTDVRLSNLSSDGYVDRATSNLKSYFLSSAFVKGGTSLRFITFSGNERTYQAWNGISEADLKTNRRVNYSGTEKPGTPYENETDNYKQDHYQFFFNQKLGQHWNLNTGIFYVKGAGYYEQYKAERSYEDYGLQNPVVNGTEIEETDLVRQLWLKNEFYGNVFSLQYTAPATEATFGGSVTKYVGHHFGDVIWAQNGLPVPKHRWYNNDAWKNDANVYGKLQQQFGAHWYAYTDLQLRSVHYRITGFRDNPGLAVNNDYLFFNPKLGLTYANGGLTAYASYSVAQKEPNRDDFETGVTQQPKSEKLHDLELGLERREKKYNWGITGYYMRYKDQLVLTGQINDVGAYTRTNIPKSYRLGVELQGAAILAPWAQVSANLTISQNKVLGFSEFIDDYDNNDQKVQYYDKADIAFSPNLIAGAQLTLAPLRNLTVMLNGKHVGRQYLDNTGQASRSLDAFFVADGQVRYELKVNGIKGVSLIGQVYNLFDKMYAPNGFTFSYYAGNQLNTENYYYPMAGRNYMAGINIRL